MKVLITGIEGFVGPYLADLLLKKGHEVYGTFFAHQTTAHPVSTSDVKKIQLDITDKKQVIKVFADVNPDEVYHLAGFSSVKQSWDNPELCRKVNVEGTRNILDGVIAAGNTAKVLVVSSAEVYGKPQKLPITENHPLNPDNPYAKSRKEQEEVVQEHIKNKKMRAVITRSFNHTGPGQSPTFVCGDFAHQIGRIEKGLQEPCISVGDLSIKRDFTDVRDVVRAYVLTLEKGKSGGVYNVCSGKTYMMQEILDILIKIARKEIRAVQDPDKIRSIDIPELRGDNSKLKDEIKWNAQIDIKKTMNDMVESIRNTLISR